VGDPPGRRRGVNPLDQVQLIQPGWRDVLEIAVVAYAVYRVLLLLHGSRALQIALGIALLFASYAAAWFLKLGLVTYLLGIIFTYGAFALLVVFQPELRSALARLGQARLGRFFRRMEAGEVAEAVGEAVERLSRSGIGAIIALERDAPLGDYVQSGSAMEAKVSADLLATMPAAMGLFVDGVLSWGHVRALVAGARRLDAATRRDLDGYLADRADLLARLDGDRLLAAIDDAVTFHEPLRRLEARVGEHDEFCLA
jgi:DNA integrity scanning protein DisA with diadenylate cyclase activity